MNTPTKRRSWETLAGGTTQEEEMAFSRPAHEEHAEFWGNLVRRALSELPRTRVAPATGEMVDILYEVESILREMTDLSAPGYAGHMIAAPHPLAWAASALTMWLNPNNQTHEVGAPTTVLEIDAIDAFCRMVGFTHGFGHLTSSGTIANLEAQWTARELTGRYSIVLSPTAHYNHRRIANMLALEVIDAPLAPNHTIDARRLREVMTHDVALIVATMGTTGMGMVDPLHEILPIAREFGARVHVDAAYGGYYALVGRSDTPSVAAPPWLALDRADSITIDPHKHGLQPYGCGCLLYRDDRAAKVLAHDSPYTYIRSDAPNLGARQFECSRGGAAAAALWATIKAFPLVPGSRMESLLRACRSAAIHWAAAIRDEPVLHLVTEPDLDIVTFAPVGRSYREVTDRTQRLLEAAGRQGITLTRLWLDADDAERLWPDLVADDARIGVLRACLMKEEHAIEWPVLHATLVDLATRELNIHPQDAP